jgi:hypothetical protein
MTQRTTDVGTRRFDDAFARAARLAADFQRTLGVPVALVRNVAGRLMLLLDDRGSPVAENVDGDIERALADAAGRFMNPPGVTRMSELRDASNLFPDHAAWHLELQGQVVRVFERTLHGDAWTATPSALVESPPRATLFGFKGGVGRSTAAVALAVAAARQGLRVLLVDFDLESPGIGPTLFGANSGPDFGLVDLLIEDVVGQLDGDLVRQAYVEVDADMGNNPGSIVGVPAGGRWRPLTYEYVEKLVRVDVATGQPERGLGARLESAVAALEAELEPDLTLIDSRAGIHDLAATAVTQLGALAFLFGVDTPQTWHGYRMLMSRWQRVPERLVELRERLQMVAALLPAPSREEALDQFRDRAFELFSELVYDEQAPGVTTGFSFALHDRPAPHNPLPIVWSDALLRFNPLVDRGWLSGPAWAAVEPFAIGALDLIGPRGAA